MLFGQPAESGAGLEQFVGSVARRLRAAAATRGAGALGLTALCATAACVFLANRAAFSEGSVAMSRLFLLGVLTAACVLLLIQPLKRLSRGKGFARAADEAERRSRALDGRLRTWVDERERARASGAQPSPLLALLARETRNATASMDLDSVVSRRVIAAFGATGLLAVASLVWLGTAGPGYWSYGTARLWTGWFLDQEAPLYELKVEPGDTSIRKGGRLDVSALPLGFEPGLVEIFAKFESSVDWERAPMGPDLQGAGYRFSFSMVPESLRYYVEAGRIRSREFKVDVVAMPTVENIRLELSYPEWSGLEPGVQDPGGDIMAVEGTLARLVLTTDKPLEDGVLVVGDEEVPVRDSRAEITVTEDSAYHVAAYHKGERVRLTDDYFITVVPDEPPTAKILEPGRDWRATSIEEVTVRVEAEDDFGLRELRLEFAVNGAEQRAVRLTSRTGQLEAAGRHTFRLEELGQDGLRPAMLPAPGAGGSGELPPPLPPSGLIPGDLISYYIVARDAKREVRSDMYFINVQPFERRFSQSQQAGGGQQGQQQQDEISRRQKEIIIATWNLIKERDADDGREEEKLRESSSMLSELQATLMHQAQTLVQRTRARQLTNTDPKFERFAEFMEQAAGFMQPAAKELQAFRLDEAVSPEQQALQYLLRAENLFTDIQVSMGQGGGGGGGASRDLAEMFELEMDLEKNQYETGGGASGQQIEQEIDEAMKKLEELARRQERLADNAQDRSRASFEQRWQQEMLRREAEDLRRQLEQLQRRQQASGAQSRQSGQAGQSGRGSEGRSGQRDQLGQTIRQLERAAREMERGSQGADPRASSANAQRELQRALDAMRQQRQQESATAVGEMAEEAARLADEQAQAAAEMQRSLKVALEALKAQGGRQTGPLPTGMTREEEIDLADRKRDMRERLGEVERGLQRQSRLMRERNEDASRALMEALIELQQSEALPAMQYAEDLVRRGLAPYAASNEEAISRSMRQLRERLRDASELASQESGGEQRGLERLLAGVEDIREDMEQAMGPGGERESDQPGQGAQGGNTRGDNGQAPGGRRGGGSPGSGGGAADGEQRGGWGRAGSLGDGRRLGQFRSPTDVPEVRERMERALEAGVAEVPRLAQQLRLNREFDPREIAQLQAFARQLGDGRFLGNPELLQQEYRQLLAMLEQIEVKLRRQVELDDKEEVRAIVSEPVPETYREAVAEYYRKLGASK